MASAVMLRLVAKAAEMRERIARAFDRCKRMPKPW